MRASSPIIAACSLVTVLGTPTFAQSGATPSDSANDAIRVLVSRLELEKYKGTIKGLTQFGDRRQGTKRNRDAVNWIEATLCQLRHEHDDLRRIAEAIQESMRRGDQPPPDHLDWANLQIEKWVRLESIEEQLLEHGKKLSGLDVANLKVERWVRLTPGPRVYQTPPDGTDEPKSSGAGIALVASRPRVSAMQ